MRRGQSRERWGVRERPLLGHSSYRLVSAKSITAAMAAREKDRKFAQPRIAEGAPQRPTRVFCTSQTSRERSFVAGLERLARCEVPTLSNSLR